MLGAAGCRHHEAILVKLRQQHLNTATSPVRPTTPIFSLGRVLKLSPLSTGSSPGRYLTARSSAWMTPWAGHPSGGRCPVEGDPTIDWALRPS